jgi:hypothetical protein
VVGGWGFVGDWAVLGKGKGVGGRWSGASLTLPMEGGLPVRVGVRVREGGVMG